MLDSHQHDKILFQVQDDAVRDCGKFLQDDGMTASQVEDVQS